MIGFKPNDYEEPKKKTEHTDTDFSRFRRERLDLRSTEMRDAFRKYNRDHRSL